MSNGHSGKVAVYTAQNPHPNPYTGPHKWRGHTAGQFYAECAVCGAVQIDPGPGTPDPPPERTPGGDWYAPHEPSTCEPKTVTVSGVGGTCGDVQEVTRVLTDAGYRVAVEIGVE